MSNSSMNTEDIKNVIFEYLDRENVKDAILIKGNWGSGKTYFLKNEILESITEKYSNPKVVYISLFGLKNLDDLKANLIVELLPDKMFKNFLKKGGYRVGLKLIAAKLNIDVTNLLSSISFSTYLKEDYQYIFVFDDLERLADGFGYATLLGWINNFIEHNHIKTILIANENEISDKSYSEYKEKVIGTSVLFFSENAYEDVIEKFSEKTKLSNYFKDHKSIFDFCFKERSENNLRTFEFGLNNLRYVFEVLEKEVDEKANTKDIQEKLILLTMGLSLMYKQGLIDDNNKSELHFDDEYDPQLDFIFETFSKAESSENEDLRAVIENNFFKRFGYNFTPVNEILNLVVNGTFDKSRFNRRILQLAGLNTEKSDIVFQKIINFKSLESIDELESTVDDAIDLLKVPSYDLKQTLILMDIILRLAHIELIPYTVDKLNSIFLEIFDNEGDNFEYFDTLNYQFENPTREYGDYFSELVKKALQINEIALNSIRKKVKEDLFDELKNNPTNFTSLVYELGHQNNMIFDEWDIKDTLKCLINGSNTTIHMFRNFIQSRYSSHIALYEKERGFLDDLNKLIQSKLDDLDKVKAFNFKTLIDQIEIFEKMYEETNQQKNT